MYRRVIPLLVVFVCPVSGPDATRLQGTTIVR